MASNRQRRVPPRPDGEPQRTAGDDEPEELGSRMRARTSFTDWLAAEGAPWRPFDDRGELVRVQGQEPGPRIRPTRAELFGKDCERQLIRHLKTVCLWPARDRDKTWRLGDYSRYEPQFEVPGRAVLTVQFNAEPDERTGNGAVSFGVSSRRVRRAGVTALDAARQEMLRDHGFVMAMRGADSSGGQFRKQVLVPGGRAVRALARETIAILCKVLDYDGATPLEYRMHLGTRLSAGFAFVGARDEQEATAEGQYGMIGLRTFMRFEGGVPEELPNAINGNFATVKACVDEDGDLVVQMPLVLHGGVTAANLEMCFRIWRETLEEISEGLE